MNLEQENYDEKIIRLIGTYLSLYYPKFNKDEVDTHEMIDARGFIITNFYDMENGAPFGKYREGDKELQLSKTLFNELEGTFGDYMEFVIDWFNNEFGEDAEYVIY